MNLLIVADQRRPRRLWVSILVFVELAPGPPAPVGPSSAFQSFNPCFCGTRARTLDATDGAITTEGFNPCFCGTRARTGNPLLAWGSWAMFQSLFLWNSRPDPGSRGPSRSGSSCFNPCFCGTRARTIGGRSPGSPSDCFNPCFCGTRARTAAAFEDTSDFVEFQSLFLWNSRPDTGNFQVFNGEILGFNPCFCGTRARTPSRRPAPFQQLRVSILVFVELAPGQRPIFVLFSVSGCQTGLFRPTLRHE